MLPELDRHFHTLANHKSNASLVTDPEVAGQNSRANYVVKQRIQLRSPIMGSEMALAARVSATAGHVPSNLIPFLALRFPLPRPAPNDPNAHRFTNLALHASGHNSNESLRNAIQLHQSFSQTYLRNSLLSLWTKQLSSGCGKAHPASTLEVIQIQLLARCT